MQTQDEESFAEFATFLGTDPDLEDGADARPRAESVPVATGSATLGGIAVLVILAAVGALLIARRRPVPQSLLPDLRAAPSRWWRALSDAERNLTADFRHHFEK